MALSVVVVVVVEKVAAPSSSIATSFRNSNRRVRERDNGGSELLITDIFLYYSIWASS